jgi:hypothetical protein
MVHTNLNLSGAVAQYGRGVGIIQATAAQLINQFAKCLREKLAHGYEAATLAPAAGPSPAPVVQSAPSVSSPPAKPISGFALMAKAAWSWLIGFFRKSENGEEIRRIH